MKIGIPKRGVCCEVDSNHRAKLVVGFSEKSIVPLCESCFDRLVALAKMYGEII